MPRWRAGPSALWAMLRRSSAAPPSGRSAGSTVRASSGAPTRLAPRRPIRTFKRNGRLRGRNEGAMSMLICFGLGYSAEHFVGMFGDGFERIVGTVRGAERAAVLNAHLAGRLKAFVFDGAHPTAELRGAIGEAEFALITVPPDENGDPVLGAFGDAFANAH